MAGPALSLILGATAAMSAAQHAPPRYPLACTYENRLGDLRSFSACARFASGKLRVAAKHLRNLGFDGHGLASIHVGDSWYYVRRDGVSAPVMTMDNFAEGFANGLARSRTGGKIGFVDRKLRLVVPRRYDGALPFERGVAQVCTGCTIASDGEHHWYRGGSWIRIDKRGRRIP